MGERLERRKLGNVTLVYSPESEAIAANVLGYAAKCNEYLAKLFEPEAPVQQTVHWLAKHDWRGRPESYGFPYASGRDAILAAADVDLPTQLALIADDPHQVPCASTRLRIQPGGQLVEEDRLGVVEQG